MKCPACGGDTYLDKRTTPIYGCSCGWSAPMDGSRELGSESIPMLLDTIRSFEIELMSFSLAVASITDPEGGSACVSHSDGWTMISSARHDALVKIEEEVRDLRGRLAQAKLALREIAKSGGGLAWVEERARRVLVALEASRG